MTWRGIAAGVCLFLGLSLLVSACTFRTLKAGLERAAEQVVLAGHASIAGTSSEPIVVVVYTVPAGQVADLFVLLHPGPFFFALPAGVYGLGAFEDRNRNLTYEAGEEPAVVFGAPTNLVLRPGERRSDLDLAIDAHVATRLPVAVSAASPQRQINQFPAPQLGTIVDIADPRFSEENAKLGLWDPLQFLFNVGAGVYFLEEYDPDKVPVLFVHGAIGHPGNWRELVAALDRSRFQPWLAYYPTAPKLDLVAQMLVRMLGTLEVKYGFKDPVLVAHSMGGLVTRAALNHAVANAVTGLVVRVPAFVTISSPWNGHTGAAKGVKYAPVVAPSWEDMAPGSAFLSQLPQTPLPPECTYTLLFSYRGGGREANDGTVTVASELSMPIQRQAAHLIGFDETHTSILRSREVSDRLNEILARATP